MSRFADVTSDTRHGPRHVPEGHIDADGNRTPATRSNGRSRLLVWGGVGIAAAATTAFGILAVRAVADAVSGDAEDRPRRIPSRGRNLAPRFAEMDARERAEMRSRARAEVSDYEARADEARRAALRERRRQSRQASTEGPGFFDNLSGNAVKLATNITALIAAANAAVDGFQQISGRADGMVRDFTDTADRLRGFLDRRSTDGAPRPTGTDGTDSAQKPDLSPEEPARTASRDRTHSL